MAQRRRPTEVPRSWAVDESDFGSKRVEWRDLPTGLFSPGKKPSKEGLYQQALRNAAVTQGSISAMVGVLLEEAHMTRSKLAERSGLDESQISRLLSGFLPMSLRHLVALDAALGGGLLNNVISKRVDPR